MTFPNCLKRKAKEFENTKKKSLEVTTLLRYLEMRTFFQIACSWFSLHFIFHGPERERGRERETH
jgi:hypothetical protein